MASASPPHSGANTCFERGGGGQEMFRWDNGWHVFKQIYNFLTIVHLQIICSTTYKVKSYQNRTRGTNWRGGGVALHD